MMPRLDRWTEIAVPSGSWAGSYEQGRAGWDGEMTSGSSWRRGRLSLSSGDTTWWLSQRQHQLLPWIRCAQPQAPRKKRPRQVGASMASPPHDIKFQNLVLFILEKKMETTRRNFSWSWLEGKDSGLKWAQVRHQFQLVNKQGFCERLWNPRNLCFPSANRRGDVPRRNRENRYEIKEQIWGNYLREIRSVGIWYNYIETSWQLKDKVIFFCSLLWDEVSRNDKQKPSWKLNAETTKVYSWLSWTKASLSPNKNCQLLGGRKNSLVGWPVSCTSGWAEVEVSVMG